MERIRDLLDESGTESQDPFFSVNNIDFLYPRSRGTFLEGRSRYISSKDEFNDLWLTGTKNRRVGQTKMNSVFIDIEVDTRTVVDRTPF